LASHLEQTTSLGTPNAQPLQVPTTQACRGLLANDFVLAGQNHGSSNSQVQHLPFPQCNKGKSLRIPARLQDVPNFDPQICSVFQIWCLIQVFIAFPGSPQGTHGIPKLAASQLPSLHGNDFGGRLGQTQLFAQRTDDAILKWQVLITWGNQQPSLGRW